MIILQLKQPARKFSSGGASCLLIFLTPEHRRHAYQQNNFASAGQRDLDQHQRGEANCPSQYGHIYKARWQLSRQPSRLGEWFAVPTALTIATVRA
jgi:hypothetical protein